MTQLESVVVDVASRNLYQKETIDASKFSKSRLLVTTRAGHS